MGGRKLSVFPVTMSIFMSFISAILVIGNTAEMYLYGIQNWLSIFSAVAGYFFVAHMFIPLFYKLNITSSFEVINHTSSFNDIL